MNNNIIFYFGIIIIILVFAILIYSSIKTDESVIEDEMDLNRDKTFIILNIFLLIGAIIVWRIIFLIIFYGSVTISQHYDLSQKILNG